MMFFGRGDGGAMGAGRKSDGGRETAAAGAQGKG